MLTGHRDWMKLGFLLVELALGSIEGSNQNYCLLCILCSPVAAACMLGTAVMSVLPLNPKTRGGNLLWLPSYRCICKESLDHPVLSVISCAISVDIPELPPCARGMPWIGSQNFRAAQKLPGSHVALVKHICKTGMPWHQLALAL